MRPIVAATNSPTTALAKYIAQVLSSSYSTDNNYYIKDSFDFSIFISNYILPDGYVVLSFDVVSLFTNLSFESVIVIKTHCFFNWFAFNKTITHIYNTHYLVFQDFFYLHMFRTPMGSRMSPILVNFVLDDLIETCANKINYNIPFVKRYVNVLVLAFPAKKIKETLDVLNAQTLHIQLPKEEEIKH